MQVNFKEGEQLFSDRMKQQGYIVEDVSKNPEYWDKDIDFIVTSPTSGLTKTFEVKWDSRIHKTENLYLELSSIYSKGGRGWFEFCKADYLAYGDAVSRVFYIIPLLELKKQVKRVGGKLARCNDESTGLLVNINDISSIVEIL